MSALNNKIGRGYILGSTLISGVLALLIIVVLFINSWDAISSIGSDLFSAKWNPSKNEYGILPMLFGTFVVTIIALVLAVPLGIITAIFTSEFLPKKYRLVAKSLLELLAGIPSIIYGLIGIAFFSVWIQDVFSLQSGRTILTAGILLAIMILPTIITLTDDALQSVPEKYRESARGLGLYNYEVLKTVLLPMSKNDISSASLLALGRSMGETMAVMLLIGSIDRIPDPFWDWLTPGQTITSKLGRELAESAFGSTAFSAMICMGLILMLFVMLLTVAAQIKFKPTQRLYE